jgi:DMSO/TMAO reductase YedYZ heme-binding membrane subunit
MTYRGFSQLTSFARWGLSAVAIGIVLGATGPQTIRLLSASVAANSASLPWVASRILAFIAYGALAGSVIYGLLLSTKVLDSIAHRPVTFTLHKDLAAIGLGLAALHGALLGLDTTVPNSLGQLLVPFASSYRPIWVGMGQISLYLMSVVVASFYVRRRIGQRAWRLLHYLTFLAFAGATAHGLLAGTDSSGWGQWIYLAATDVVVFLFAYRIAVAIGGRGRSRAPGAQRRTGAPTLAPATTAGPSES